MKRNVNPRGTRGFTLVELLVVMAIIAILASIVVPNVARYITKSRMTNALSEIKNAETAFTGMLASAQVSNFRDFFNPREEPWVQYIPNLAAADQVYAAQKFYTEAFYLLLRYGKDAENYVTNQNIPIAAVGLDDQVIRKLGASSMEFDKDPWGNLYNVYAGPWRAPNNFFDTRYPPFRVRQVDITIPGNISRRTADSDPYVVGETFYGPKDLPIYVYSSGQDKAVGQSLFAVTNGYETSTAEVNGGGDDIGNWDTEQSYDELY